MNNYRITCPQCFGSKIDILHKTPCQCSLVREYPAPTKPGLYLMLMHGFPEDGAYSAVRLNWGIDGPIIGPLSSVHSTYGNLRIFFCDKEPNGESEERGLPMRNSLIVYDNICYGDWEVFYMNEEDISLWKYLDVGE
jgi:hypothetical protein